MRAQRYTPFKYVLGMIGLFGLFPALMIYLFLGPIPYNDYTVTVVVFFAAWIVFLGPVTFIINRNNASIVINGKQLMNFMNDGRRTYYGGSAFIWEENVEKIQSMILTDKTAVQEWYPKCRAKKVLLFDFGGGNVKFISVSLFTEKQLKTIMAHIDSIRSNAVKQ